MKKMFLILPLVCIANVVLFAQQAPAEDPIGKEFFSPELVMQNQQAINLTESQRTSMQNELQSVQSEFTSMQWDLQKEMEKFKLLIAKENPVEAEVSGQLDRVLAMENKIKKRQVLLLTRIKNLLNHDQKQKLMNIKQ